MRFSDAFLDEIRDRVLISSVVGARVAWDRRKTNASRGDWWACCPFHGEKSPSFHCEDKKGRYHCFGCGVSGDHFRFLTDLDGMSFPEAVERIAELAGVPMPTTDPEAEKRLQIRNSLQEVLELAAKFFQDQLQAPGGAKARGYLRDRGLTSATQQAFRLGYAPDSRNALKEFLANKGVGPAQLEASGLIVFGDDIPVSYDRFRDRVMFPIEDARGKVVAFGGRALSAEVSAKYLNSPETELFHKGALLYNYARARKEQPKDGTIIAVEGYMDVIALSQAGFGNVVAPLGTALTETQLDLLWKVTQEPVLCFDGDQAGQRAAYRATELALPKISPGRSVRFAILPEGQDPDDLVKTAGKDAFLKILEDAIPMHEFFIMRRRAEMPIDTPEQKAAFENTLRGDINSIKDISVREQYVSHYRLRTAQQFYNTSKSRITAKAANMNIKLSSEIHSVRVILGLCVEYPAILADFVEEISHIEYNSSAFSVFAQELRRLYIEFAPKTVAEIYEKIDPRFFFVLENIHGSEFVKTVSTPAGRFIATYKTPRGHRLRQIFPMVRYNPPLELVNHTVYFYLMVIHRQIIAEEIKRESPGFSERDFQAAFAEMERLGEEIGRVEKELDEEYQHLAGRLRFGQSAA